MQQVVAMHQIKHLPQTEVHLARVATSSRARSSAPLRPQLLKPNAADSHGRKEALAKMGACPSLLLPGLPFRQLAVETEDECSEGAAPAAPYADGSRWSDGPRTLDLGST